MKKYIKSIITATLTLCAPMYMGVMAQTAPNIDADLTGMRAIGSPANPKVKWAWNYYMDYAGFNKLTQELAKAYPDLVKYESIGKSYQGREMYVITITDFKSGRPSLNLRSGLTGTSMPTSFKERSLRCTRLGIWPKALVKWIL